MAPWIWMLLGVILLLGEVLTPGGFYILFFGVGALLVGALAGTGLVESLWLQWLLFPIFSVAALLLLREPLMRRVKPAPQVDADPLTGTIGTVMEPLPPGGVGRVEVRGAAWQARNVSSVPLAVGARCRVKAVDGLMLLVEAE